MRELPVPASGRIERRFATLPYGEIHFASMGDGHAVVLLHQTPRSWDEFRDVLPLLGLRYRAIAMDTLGFGDSFKPPRLDEDSIELWAEVSVGLLDALGIDTASFVGHHAGAVIAMEIAAAYPERVDAVVLSSAPFVQPRPAGEPRHLAPVDEVEPDPDGAHVAQLWRLRQPYYPEGDIALLERFLIDAEGRPARRVGSPRRQALRHAGPPAAHSVPGAAHRRDR